MKSNSQDWRAISSSFVFQEYMKNEMEKTADEQRSIKQSEASLDEFKKFESKIRKNAKLYSEFSAMQDKIIDDPDFRRSLDPKFVTAMLSLDLIDGEV